MENGNTPAEASLPRADRDAMAEYVENLRMVLGVLGYPILEPLIKSHTGSIDFSVGENSQNVSTPLSNLIFRVNNLVAYGALTDEGFVIKKGSMFSPTNSESLSGKLVSMKERFIVEGILISSGEHLISNEDILMSSSSYAAAIVAGTSRSGPQSWKTISGKTLKELEDAALKDIHVV